MDYIFHWGVFLEQAAANETYLDWMISGLKVTIALGPVSYTHLRAHETS